MKLAQLQKDAHHLCKLNRRTADRASATFSSHPVRTAFTEACICPHDSNANQSRGTTRQTSPLSVSVSAASVTTVVVAAEVDAGVAVASCVASCSVAAKQLTTSAQLSQIVSVFIYRVDLLRCCQPRKSSVDVHSCNAHSCIFSHPIGPTV